MEFLVLLLQKAVFSVHRLDTLLIVFLLLRQFFAERRDRGVALLVISILMAIYFWRRRNELILTAQPI